MRKILLSVLPVILALAVPAAAKVDVELHKPPEGQLGVEHLWWVDLNNTTRETFHDVWLRGEVREAEKGVVFRANSSTFDLPPGRKRIRSGDVRILNPWYARGFEVFLGRTGKVPPGKYTYVVMLEPQLGGDSNRVTVREPTPPRLVAPKDGDTITVTNPSFTWTPPGNYIGPLSYRHRVVEVNSDQTSEQALARNPAWFEQPGIRGTSLRYPSGARPFGNDRRYAWEVVAELGGGGSVASDHRSFVKRRQWKLGTGTGPIEVLCPLKIERAVTRFSNWYRVELTLTNIGTSSLTEIKLRDSHRHFQCIDDARRRRVPPPGGEEIPGWTTEREDAGCTTQGADGGFGNELEILLGSWVLPPGQSFTVRYSVLPLLTVSIMGPGHTIGTRLWAGYRVGDQQYSWEYTGKAVQPVPGLAQAWKAADYIICTCPPKLQAPGINGLLTTMARLAKARQGVLLYFTGSTLTAAMARNVFKAMGTLLKNGWQDGYLLIVGEEDVVPHRPDFTDWFKKDGVWTESPVMTRSDYYYSNLGGDRRPEVAVGRIIGRDAGELRIPIDVSLAVKAGEAENDGSRSMMISGHEKISDAFPVVAESGAAYLRREKSTSVASWHGEYYATRERTMHKAIIHAPWPSDPPPRGADKCCKYCNPRPCGCGCTCLNLFTDRQLAAWVLQERMGIAAFDAAYPPQSADVVFADVNGRFRRVPAVFGPSHINGAATEAAQIEFERGGYFGVSYLFLPTNAAAHSLFVSRIKSNLAGRDLIVYNGHSGSGGWYGVDVSTVTGTNIMSSPTRPVAVCFGCSGGNYPGSGNSISRVFMRQGAGAYIGATQMINTADANRQVRDKGFLKHWARGKRIGDVHRDWKDDMAAHTILTSGLDLRLLYVMNLYGDPKFGGD